MKSAMEKSIDYEVQLRVGSLYLMRRDDLSPVGTISVPICLCTNFSLSLNSNDVS